MNRTKIATKNINISLLLMLTDSIASFTIRTVFIKFMLVEELGLNSLFTDISTLLSIAESGVGAAFSSVLYKAFYDEDQDKIYAIYKNIRKAYILIAGVVFALSIILFPYVTNRLIDNQVHDILQIYVLFVIKTVIVYAYSSYYMLLYSDQKIYIYKNYCFLALLFRVAIQLCAILIFKSFVVYFFASTIYELLPYVFVKYKVKKMYHLERKSNADLVVEEKKLILKRIVSGAIVHIAYIIFNGTDFVLITRFLGLSIAGVYSNYAMFISMVTTVISSIFTAITSSVGDMLCEKDNEKIWTNYRIVLFANIVLISGAAMCFFALFQPVITLWIGTDFLLKSIEMVLIVIVFCVGDYGLFRATDAVRLSSGIYEKDKWYCLIAGILNIVLSVVLAKKIGLIGILIATIFTASLYHIPGIYYVQKEIIQKPIIDFVGYFMKILFKMIFICAASLLAFKLTLARVGLSLLGLVLSVGVMGGIFVISGIVLLRNEKEYIFFVELFQDYLIKIRMLMRNKF